MEAHGKYIAENQDRHFNMKLEIDESDKHAQLKRLDFEELQRQFDIKQKDVDHVES